MSNILDYLDWRGDLSFAASPFNPVDNLIFSKLIYVDFSVCALGGSSCPLSELFDAYVQNGGAPNGRAGDPYPLFEKCAGTKRYGEVRLSGYYSFFSEELTAQFACGTFLLPGGGAVIAFKGTDDSFVGWREDVELSYSPSTEGQRQAAVYLQNAAGRYEDLILCGHSKGGNLAVYAAAFSGVGEKVDRIFSNDGPGLNARLTATPEYQAISGKIRKYIPESSIVGVLLPDECRKIIVKSTGRGLGQHNVYTWEVLGDSFVLADKRSASSVFTDEAVQRWMVSMDEDRRTAVLCDLFDALEASGCKTFRQLNEKKRASYNAILTAVRKYDPERRREILRALKNAAKSSGEVIYDSAKKSFEKSGAWQTIKKLRKKEMGKPHGNLQKH